MREENLHVINAGDPGGLHQSVRNHLTEELRIRKFQNRTLDEQAPTSGGQAETHAVQAAILVETQPLPVPARDTRAVRRRWPTREFRRDGRRRRPLGPLHHPGQVLDVAAVAVTAITWGLWLYAHRCGTLLGCGVVLATWFVGLGVGRTLIRLAYSAWNTYRFYSDLYWVEFEGTRHSTRVGVSGGFGRLTSERQGVSSDLWVKLKGAGSSPNAIRRRMLSVSGRPTRMP